MFQLNLDSRSPYRYYAHFRTPSSSSRPMGSFFSVEIHIAEQEWDTMLTRGKRFMIETCEIMQPETKIFYELRERHYVASQDIVSELGRILVEYRVIPEGTPFKVNLDLEGRKFSFMQMNSKVKYASECTHFENVNRLWNEFGAIEVSHDDEILSDWEAFEAGTDRFEIWKWFEQSFGYPVKALGGCHA
ncbi:hypothetical protein QUN99_003417 [Vibrio parahaemolyticus]|nr:hypothetical protein [Vibrio parahaemolyticus]